jgi:serine/threonine-protein kinase
MILAGDYAGPRERQRFRVEAEALAGLRHPHIAQVYESGEHQGRPYLAMEYLEGGSLARFLGGRPQPPCEAAALVATLAGAVHHAHERGVIHRDLKPSNILLQPLPRPAGVTGPQLLPDFAAKVTDFGLAKQVSAEVTQTEGVVGTPAYMPPEQAAADQGAPQPTADVYGLGAILYEVLTGRPPFQGRTMLETLDRVRTRDPVPPRRLNRQVSRDLEAVCLKCLEKDPRRRYQSALELAEELNGWLAGKPVRARHRRWPERARRWAWRHPSASAVIGLVFVVAAGVGFAARRWEWEVTPRPPSGQLPFLRKELAEGRAVLLLQRQGLPGHYRWVAGKKNLHTERADLEPLFLESWDMAMLELLPDLPCGRYRVQAEVRAEKGTATTGQAGLYVGHERRDTPAGPEDSFATFSLSYEGPAACAAVDLQRYRAATRAGAAMRRVMKYFSYPLPDRSLGKFTWHKLVLEVTTEELTASWQGNRLGRSPAHAPGLPARLNALLALDPPWRDGPVRFRAGGGLGVYVWNHTASFRNVVVEPLAEGQ